MRWWIVAMLVACGSAPAPAPISATKPPERAQPPPPPKTVITTTDVQMLDPIKFLSGSAAFDPRSMPILDAIARTLTGNPSIKLVAVHAYGADALAQFQAQVGADRARAIIDQLVARGVAPHRLIGHGAAVPPPGMPVVPAFEILARDP